MRTHKNFIRVCFSCRIKSACLNALMIVVFTGGFSCEAGDFVLTAKVDLNGDGKEENVSLSGITKTGDFVLTVDKVAVKGKFSGEEEADGFCIVDVDTADKYKEIAVHTPGPSSDDEYMLFWYDGKMIRKMGALSRWPEFPGDGSVVVGDWMGFWIKKDSYVLNSATRTFEFVPQEFYYVGIEATAGGEISVYRQKRSAEAERVCCLKPGDKVFILVCDFSPEDFQPRWYLVKTCDGLTGWISAESIAILEDLPWAD